MKTKNWATGALTACLVAACVHASAEQADEVMRANFNAAMLAAELAGESLADYEEDVVVSSDSDGQASDSPAFLEASTPDQVFSDLPEVEQVGYAVSSRVLNDCRRGPRGRSYQVFAGAEYIYARASFSEALAFMTVDTTTSPQSITRTEFDFDYNSSYSFYGGVRLCDCLGAIVFDFDRYRSEGSFSQAASSTTGVNILAPFEVTPPAGGRLDGSADVDLQSYDIGFQKTIPLGGCICDCCDSCDGCCDSGCCDGGCCDDPCCGGGGGCCRWCPLWDITWSAAFRIADVNTAKGATSIDASQNAIRSYVASMDFEGYGGRIGIGGRRYFGKRGRFSLFAQGDLSILVGDMTYIVQENDLTTPGNSLITTSVGRRVIPVTEIEAGGTLHLGDHVQASAGYFIGAWHDLGFRDESELGIPATNPSLLDSFDDANILGFDGFFARVEVGF
ncbi:MAG: Lpg1974 family pore-forming outer membrane protein [Planctomycetota bacterium]